MKTAATVQKIAMSVRRPAETKNVKIMKVVLTARKTVASAVGMGYVINLLGKTLVPVTRIALAVAI